MKVRIDKDLCTGCGPCADISPEVFEIKDDVSVVIAKEVSPDQEQTVREAAEACPTGAIIIEE